MSIFTIIVIALGLAMDAFAVSISSGLTLKKINVFNALKISGFFGGFQAFMPVLGWWSGTKLKNVISGFDHWIAFFLLLIIGLKMIAESKEIEEEANNRNPLKMSTLLLLSVATSIDAFAVGLSLALILNSLLLPIIIIGIVTFILSFVGVYIGETIGHFFESKIEILGGIILIFIGFKILIEHLFYS